MSEWRRVKSVGIWGDGSVGYLLSLCLKKEFPNLLRQLPAFFYSLPRGSLKTATVA